MLQPFKLNGIKDKLIAPNLRENYVSSENHLDKYYPNLSTSVIKDDIYILPANHDRIDSRTIRIYTADNRKLNYVENPYSVYTKTMSFSLLPTVNSTGYSLVFSRDISSGTISESLYYFYIQSEGYDIANNSTPDFSTLGSGIQFAYSYAQESSQNAETADEARKRIATEFDYRDAPKAIITAYDAERAILQLIDIVAAVCVKDVNNYTQSVANTYHAFIKTTETAENNIAMSANYAQTYKEQIEKPI